MTQNEARALLNLNGEQDLDEQLEFALFEYKQKIYRQLDQVLLYPKWMAALHRLQSAAEVLGFSFTENKPLPFQFDVHFTTQETLVTNFNAYQQVKARVAQLIYNSSNPTQVCTILNAFLEVQRQWFNFLAQVNLPRMEVKLSQQFDPQAILLQFKSLESKGLVRMEDLQEETTPKLLQEWISWQKAMLQKMKSN